MILEEIRRRPKSGRRKESPMPRKDFGLTAQLGQSPEQDCQLAERLFALLRKHKRVAARKYNPAGWIAHIKRLRRRNVSHKRIDTAITWLEKHLTDKYVPRVFSAASFCSKFTRIEEAMGRTEDVEVSTSVKLLCDQLRLIWPNDEKEDEALFTQRCLSNYSRIVRHVCHSSSDKDLPPRLRNLCAWLFKGMPSPTEFVKRWLLKVHRISYRWDNWRGKEALQIWVVSPNNKHFRDQVELWALGFCIDFDKRWNELLRIWQDENKKEQG
jgi:hypothetical protein